MSSHSLTLPLPLPLLVTCVLAGCVPPRAMGPAAPGPQSLDLRGALARQATHVRGPRHSALEPLVGDWDLSVTVPGRSEIAGRGLARVVPVHGGLFLRIDEALELAGEPVTLTGYLGHDLESGDYQALWLSDLSSGMTLLVGRGDLRAGGLELRGRSAQAAGRSLWRFVDDDHLVVESRGPGPDGAERLLRRTDWTRRVTK